MKKRLVTSTLLAIALASGMALAAPASAGVSAALAVHGDVGFFYDALAPYGSWVTVEAYGNVWVPRVSRYWRPYSEGHWVFTDDGWCWVDDEPWGWATFHYGRWYLDPVYGWVWVPGDVWAPAWVAWRWGDGFVGWAPLPPDVGWSFGVGLSFSDFDLDRRVGPSYWCFVDQRHFTDPRVYSYLAPTTNNITYVRMTRNITNYTVVNNRVFDRGVDVRQVERFTGRPVTRMRIVDRQAPGVHVTGREVGVYRPAVHGRAELRRGPQAVQPRGRGVVERPHSPAVAQRPPAANVRRFNVQRQQERPRVMNEQRARVSRAVPPQQPRGRQYVEKQAVSHQQVRERRVVEPRVQPNPRPNVTRARAPERRPPANAHGNAQAQRKPKAQGKGNGNG